MLARLNEKSALLMSGEILCYPLLEQIMKLKKTNVNKTIQEMKMYQIFVKVYWLLDLFVTKIAWWKLIESHWTICKKQQENFDNKLQLLETAKISF